jgi:hypothetical protein
LFPGTLQPKYDMGHSAYRGNILITPRSLTKKYHPAFDKLKEAGFELLFCQVVQQPTKEELASLLMLWSALFISFTASAYIQLPDNQLQWNWKLR